MHILMDNGQVLVLNEDPKTGMFKIDKNAVLMNNIIQISDTLELLSNDGQVYGSDGKKIIFPSNPYIIQLSSYFALDNHGNVFSKYIKNPIFSSDDIIEILYYISAVYAFSKNDGKIYYIDYSRYLF